MYELATLCQHINRFLTYSKESVAVAVRVLRNVSVSVHVPLMSRLLSTLWQNIEQNFIWNSYVRFGSGGSDACVVCVGKNPVKRSCGTCFRFCEH